MHIHRCSAALIVRQGEILLGLRSPALSFCPNVWDVIGGHIEPDEQPEQSLVRELREELGITPTRWAHLETLVDEDQERDEAVECHFYLVTAWTGAPRNLAPEEHTRIAWFSLDQAVQLDLAHRSYPALFARALATDHVQ